MRQRNPLKNESFIVDGDSDRKKMTLKQIISIS